MAPKMPRIARRIACLAALSMSSAAFSKPLPDRFVIGRDAEGNRCSAITAPARATTMFDRAYVISCEGATAGRSIGSISATSSKLAKAEVAGTCGTPLGTTVEGIGPTEMRRCYDADVAAPVVVVRFTKGGTTYRGAVTADATTPLVHALRAFAASVVPTADEVERPSPLKLDGLAQAPAVGTGSAGGDNFDPAIAWRNGSALNRQGLYPEASRVLNDALSRMPASTSQDVQIELQLEAALADSNLRFNDAAAEHFARADAALDGYKGGRASILESKRYTYGVIDNLNRRDWAGVSTSLSRHKDDFPLEDLTTLSELNQPFERTAASAAGGSDDDQLTQIMLDAQRSWALSIAQLSTGGKGALTQSDEALRRAAADVSALLNSNRDPSSLLWTVAQIERQAGRLALYRGSGQSGPEQAASYLEAVARFGCAVDVLQGRRPGSEQNCIIPLRTDVRTRLIAASAQIGGPVMAETLIERASVLSRTGATSEQVIAEYDSGIDTLLGTNRGGTSAPAGLETYLDLLVSPAQSASPKAGERFFKAVQAIGEPAIARQMSQLQGVVTAGGDTAARLRQEAELERDLRALRYQIEDASADAAKKSALMAEQKDKEQRYFTLRDELASNGRLRQVEDRPVTVAEVQKALNPGEAYFKLAEVRARLYGIVIDHERATIYSVDTPPRTLEAITRKVRLSIRDRGNRVPFFDVASSYALFNLVTGPAQDQLLAARSVIVDPAGPLAELPAGVLVTDRASVSFYVASRKTAPNDYTKVSFLAARADISTALSPRSFLSTRSLVASHAVNPFIGFGQHAAPVATVDAPAMIQVGLGCPVSRSELVRLSEINDPIPASKIQVAADAFGVPNAPRMTGEAFTDTAVKERSDLDTFQVLHFATHGLPERKLGCASIPPSLVTTIGGAGSDGFLSFGEVAGLHLDANLVVLSACQTSASASGATGRAAGQEESGRSLDGLVRAFLAANARAVLATYWEVSIGTESDELFKTFYSRGRTESIGSALRDAQLALMRQPRYSQPYFWGAYFVVGDSSKTMLTKPATVAAR